MKSPSFKERSFHIKSQPVIKNLREPLIPTIDMTKKKEKSKYPIYVSPQPLSHKFA